MPTLTISRAPSRDVRIDHIGLVDELDKHFADPLRKAVKAAHAPGDELTADLFDGKIVPAEQTTLSAEAWLRQWNNGVISRAQFLEGIKVSTSVARRVLDETTFNRLAETTPASPRLLISRRQGVNVELVDAVAGIQAELAHRRAA